MSGSLAPFSIETAGRNVWPRIPAQPVREFDADDELVNSYVVRWDSVRDQLVATRGDGTVLTEAQLRARWGVLVDEMRDSYIAHEIHRADEGSYLGRIALHHQPGAAWGR